MRILNKEITKRQVKMFIGGLLGTAVVTTIVGVALHHNKEELIEGVEYQELQEEVKPIELESFREEEA